MINMLENVKALYKEIEEFELTDSNSLESFRLEFLSKNGMPKNEFQDFHLQRWWTPFRQITL